MKKIMPLFALLMMFVMVVPAYAESPEDLPLPTFPTTFAASGDTPTDVTVDIYGTVQASVLSAEVTLASAFVINPNDVPSKRFIAPDLSITNTSNFPIQVHLVSLTKTGNGPDIVSDSKYTDLQWNSLTANESRYNIALGLRSRSADIYLPAGGVPAVPLSLVAVAPGSTEPITMKARYGMAYMQDENYKFQLVLRLAVN